MPLNILDHVVLAYEPVWGRSRALTGVRLRIRALHPESVDMARLLRLLVQERSDRAPFLLLSFADPETALQALAEAPAEGIWLELPVGQTVPDAGVRAAAQRALAAGHRLVEPIALASQTDVPVTPGILQLVGFDGQPTDDVASHAGQLFRHSRGVEAAESCLGTCPVAGVVGWPSTSFSDVQADQGLPVDRACVERALLAVEQDASLEAVEDLILQDPVLAYRAWCLLRSGVFGPDRQVDTLRQALMLMGQSRLRDWLLEQSEQATEERRWWPLRQSLVLRAYLMEQILDPGAEWALAEEIHLAGLFSRLDDVLRLPMALALEPLPLAEPVKALLLEGAGPYQPYLDVARALEDIDGIDRLPELCAAHDMRLDEVNRALVRMLRDQRVRT